MLTKELIVKIDDLAIECEDTYSMANRIEDMLEEIFNDHEAQLKQAYIDGSNSTNELIQSLYKQIEQLKDNNDN